MRLSRANIPLASEDRTHSRGISPSPHYNLAPHFWPGFINLQHFCHSRWRNPVRLSKSGHGRQDSTRFLLIYGREDDIVDPATQSEKFLTALKQAGFFARTIVVPGAGHFWASEPIDEPGSFGAYTAPKMLRFLQTAL